MTIQHYKHKKLKDVLRSQIDVFICCASYEDRCRSIADVINPESIKHALIAENKNLTFYVGTNAKYLRNKFGESTVDVALDSTDPIKTADNLNRALIESIRDESAVCYLVDVTTFTHEGLLILLRLLRHYLQQPKEVTLIYTGAKEYNPGKSVKDIWLSKGVDSIRSVLGYPGEILPSKENHLLILVGFEVERASKLIESFEPDIITLGHGKRGTETGPGHHKTNEYFAKLLSQTIAKYGGSVKDFEFSCNDPYATKQALLEHFKTLPDYNHIIAPMNTKPSTIGSALVAIEDEKIQLCYAQASQYNFDNYSSPSDSCYVLNFFDLFQS